MGGIAVGRFTERFLVPDATSVESLIERWITKSAARW